MVAVLAIAINLRIGITSCAFAFTTLKTIPIPEGAKRKWNIVLQIVTKLLFTETERVLLCKRARRLFGEGFYVNDPSAKKAGPPSLRFSVLAEPRTARIADRLARTVILERGVNRLLTGARSFRIIRSQSGSTASPLFLDTYATRPLAEALDRNEKTFPEIRVGELNQLSICIIDFTDPEDVARHERMVGLVERVLELHERLVGRGSSGSGR